MPLTNADKFSPKLKLESTFNKDDVEAKNCGFMPYRSILSTNTGGGFQLYGATESSSNLTAPNRNMYGFSLSDHCKMEEDIKQ